MSPHTTPGPGSQQNSTEKMTQGLSSHMCVCAHTHTLLRTGRSRSLSLWLASIHLRDSQMVSRLPPPQKLTRTCILWPEYGLLLLLTCFSCVRLCATLWTVACQSPLSMGFSRQEYWSKFPFPSPGDLPDPGIKKSLSSPSCLHGNQGYLSENDLLKMPV